MNQIEDIYSKQYMYMRDIHEHLRECYSTSLLYTSFISVFYHHGQNISMSSDITLLAKTLLDFVS